MKERDDYQVEKVANIYEDVLITLLINRITVL